MLPTTASVSEQRDALFRRVGEMVEAAGRSGVNVLCLQEAWSEFAHVYRVGLVVWQLGWVDLDLECSTILLGQ